MRKERVITRKGLEELARTMAVIPEKEQDGYFGLGEPITSSDPRIANLLTAIRDSSSVDLESLTGELNSIDIGSTTVYIGNDSIRIEHVAARLDGYTKANTVLYDEKYVTGESWTNWWFCAYGTSMNNLYTRLTISVNSQDRSKFGQLVNRQ